MTKKPMARKDRAKKIKNLKHLCDWLGHDYQQGVSADSLSHRMYKNTDCGASLSVYDENGKAYHNGDCTDLFAIASTLRGFTIQSIVEGSDATVDSDEFEFGVCTDKDLDDWVADMESQVDALWAEANTDEDELNDYSEEMWE